MSSGYTGSSGAQGAGAIGGIVAAAQQPFQEITSAFVANERSKKAARKAYERQVDFYKHQYQWRVEDLRAAGLNPILAFGGSGGGPGSAPAVHPAQVHEGSRGGSGGSFSAASQASLMRAQARLLEEQRVKTQHEAEGASHDVMRKKAEALSASVDLALKQEFAYGERKIGLDLKHQTHSARGVEIALQTARLPEAELIAQLYEMGGLPLVAAEKGASVAKEVADLLFKLRAPGAFKRAPGPRRGRPSARPGGSSGAPSAGGRWDHSRKYPEDPIQDWMRKGSPSEGYR